MSRHNPDVFVFQKGIERARNLCGIHAHAQAQFPKALNCDDLLRSAIITGLSALDLLMHSICKREILFRYQNKIEIRRLVVPFNFFISQGSDLMNALGSHISEVHGYKSFMAPDKIAEVLSHFLERPWEKVALNIGTSDVDVKQKLRYLVDWRNRIAHEQDINPQYGGLELWPISTTDVNEGLNFLDALGPAIAKSLAQST